MHCWNREVPLHAPRSLYVWHHWRYLLVHGLGCRSGESSSHWSLVVDRWRRSWTRKWRNKTLGHYSENLQRLAELSHAKGWWPRILWRRHVRSRMGNKYLSRLLSQDHGLPNERWNPWPCHRARWPTHCKRFSIGSICWVTHTGCCHRWTKIWCDQQEVHSSSVSSLPTSRR